MEALYHELKARAIDIEHRSEFFTRVKHINQGILRWIKSIIRTESAWAWNRADDAMLKLMGKGFDSETAFRNHEASGMIDRAHNGRTIYHRVPEKPKRASADARFQ